MNTSKIKSCSFKNEYSTKFGTFYSHNIELEDGTTGEISSSKKDPDYFQPGKELNYEVKSEDPKYGKKLKRVTPQQNGRGYSGGGGKSYDNMGATIGNAVSNATLLACHGKIEEKHLEAAARKIAKIAIKLNKELSEK